mgnify:CR=1
MMSLFYYFRIDDDGDREDEDRDRGGDDKVLYY